MFPSPDSTGFLIVAVLVFVAVVLLIEGLYLMWQSHRGPAARNIEKRLQALSASAGDARQARLLKQQALSDIPVLERVLHRFPPAKKLQNLLYQAGLKWTVSHVLLSSVSTGGFVYLILAVFVHQPLLFAAIAGTACMAMPILYIARKRNLRLTRLQLQLPEAIDLMIRAMRSGHAFNSGLQMVAEEMAEPIASEFRIVHDEISFGVSLQQALLNLSERVPLTDLRYFVVALLIQRDSGGSMTEVLGNLSRLIRERLKLVARVRVLSSEGRLSAWILVLMPFALGAIMTYFNPEFMTPLWTDPIGIGIIKYMLIMMAIGVVILRKIIKIRV